MSYKILLLITYLLLSTSYKSNHITGNWIFAYSSNQKIHFEKCIIELEISKYQDFNQELKRENNRELNQEEYKVIIKRIYRLGNLLIFEKKNYCSAYISNNFEPFQFSMIATNQQQHITSIFDVEIPNIPINQESQFPKISFVKILSRQNQLELEFNNDYYSFDRKKPDYKEYHSSTTIFTFIIIHIIGHMISHYIDKYFD